MRIFLLSITLVALPIAFPGSGITQVWDLATDWSNDFNPNGVWSYNGSTDTPITTYQSDWNPSNSAIFGSAQPAWAATPYPQNDHVPMLFKRVCDVSSIDIPVGKIGMHGNEWNDPDQWVGVVWTSPITGTINVSGGVWYAMTGHSRNADWQVRLNEIVLTTGNVAHSDGSSSTSPSDLLEGSGGAPALQSLSVNPGDTITLEFISLATIACFVGADFTITGEAVSAVSHPTPHTSALKQNHPNPFNPQTTIVFEIPKQEAVSLRVFDMSGRLVRDLIAVEPHAPGRHEVVWYGRDDSGRQVSSGTYFYRLEAGSFSETKRMVLIK